MSSERMLAAPLPAWEKTPTLLMWPLPLRMGNKWRLIEWFWLQRVHSFKTCSSETSAPILLFVWGGWSQHTCRHCRLHIFGGSKDRSRKFRVLPRHCWRAEAERAHRAKKRFSGSKPEWIKKDQRWTSWWQLETSAWSICQPFSTRFKWKWLQRRQYSWTTSGKTIEKYLPRRFAGARHKIFCRDGEDREQKYPRTANLSVQVVRKDREKLATETAY